MFQLPSQGRVLAVCVALASVGISGLARAAEDVFSDVPEAAGYTLVYDLHIATTNAFASGVVPYTTNNAASIADNSFSRVGYYLQLQANNSSATQWVYASFNADGFARSANLLGVPTAASGASFQQNVTSMNVLSNVAGIFTGTGIATGNIEFWPLNYATDNSAGVPGASGSTYDFGDRPDGGGNYGSMQIHNYGASQTVLAFNDWNNGGNADIGIGNQVGGSGHPDWTFAGNAGNYQVKDLEVVVGGPALPPPPPPPPPTPGLHIMSLGDSITDGVGGNGGYRAPLYADLKAAGLQPTMVGSLNDNPGNLPASQQNHEGHSGYTIQGLLSLPITDRINAAQPDITLLHIGTNDISQGHTLQQEHDDLEQLISTIEAITLADGKHTKLIVAEIIPRVGDNTPTIAYNSMVAAVVAEHQGLGEPVYLVDMYDAVPANGTYIPDSIHPNDAGYKLMADVWAPAIEALVPEPSSITLLALGLAGLAAVGARRRLRQG